MRIIFIGVALLMLNGCTKAVYVPVATCPKPPVIQEAALKTDVLKHDADVDSILQAMVWDITYLKGLKNQYKTLLEGYSSPQQVLDTPEL